MKTTALDRMKLRIMCERSKDPLVSEIVAYIDDIDTLELRLTQAMALLERASGYVHRSIDCPNCCTRDMQGFNPDLERFVKDGK